VALKDPLNHRQVEVLRWISEGCPDGRWTDFTYKTTASALQSRRLVEVSKRGGTWSASMSPAGDHYLAHGRYPLGHWTKRGAAVDLDAASTGGRRSDVRTWSPLPPRPPKPAPPEGLTPTRKLLKDIADAGGMLERDVRDDDTNYQSLVGMINRHKMAPDGQALIMITGKTYHHRLFRLTTVSDWKTAPPDEVVGAERVGRWHPAVAMLRSSKRLDGIEKSIRDRAFRLLQSLAKEAEARGHSVRLPKRSVHGYTDDPSKLRGDLIFKVGDVECSVDFAQPSKRVDHTPTAEELERDRKYNWPPRRYDSVPFPGLSITLDTSSRWSSKFSWNEKNGPKLQTRLPDVLTTFERWAVVHTERNEAERQAEIEKRQRQAREDVLARGAYIQDALGRRLVAAMEAWELTGRLRQYVEVLRDRIGMMTDTAEQVAALDWLSWCDRYVAEHDPSRQPIVMPTIKSPGYSEVAEFRKRLGFPSHAPRHTGGL
jgi:hypothetical protein